jgi:hypothetical protein
VKSHPYEYKVLVEYINPKEAGRYPHFTRIEDQDGLSQTLEEVFANLPESIEEGWEVNSHNIAISRNTLIITILLRRPKKPG